ncbi:MAG TPA: hypothetical protein VG838_12260 [Opitutaceae bacterium]|nr:hypothetical protein [Opitutaceae bacterium]
MQPMPKPSSLPVSSDRPGNSAALLGGVLIFLGLAWQRWELAGVAQWREDQATNLWLGLQMWRGVYFAPVGLINSLGTPNPNGLNWLGFALSALPSLRLASLALGLVQLGLIARLCWLLFRETPLLFWAALLAAGSCLQVVLTGVELWAQWTLGLLNLLFLGELVRLRQGAPPFWPVFLIVNCVFAAPALYLGGVLNSAGYAVLLAAVLWRHPARGRDLFGGFRKKVLWATALLLHGVLVWLPYVQVAGLSVTGLDRPFAQRLKESALTLAEFPVTIYRLLPHELENLTQVTPRIMAPDFYLALRLSHYAVAGLIFASLLWQLARRRFSPAALGVGFAVLLGVASPLLGGFAWGLGERLDQAPQLLPLLLVAAFGAFPLPRQWHGLLLALAVVFAGVHFELGRRLDAGLLDDRGPKLGEADLPLDDRRRAVDFIAADWAAKAGRDAARKVSVFYSFGDRELYHEPEVTTWVVVIERYGAIMANFYPDAPYTIGRGYDWELLRRWHLENQDEGKLQTERRWNGHRYTLSMVGLPVPSYVPPSAQHHEFGRVRVSVFDGR